MFSGSLPTHAVTSLLSHAYTTSQASLKAKGACPEKETLYMDPVVSFL